jgi:transcriptional regulator with XRE-family HTH domain
MPTPSSLVEVASSQTEEIGKRLKTRRTELQLTQGALSKRCDAIIDTLPPEERPGRIRRDRITKIENGTARAFYPAEITVLAKALDVARDWFQGGASDRPIFWDPLTDPEYCQQVLKLFSSYQANARLLIGWGEFLPCSLETEAFMHAHNAAILKDLPGTDEQKQTIIAAYDEIGNARRKALLAARAESTWDFYHVIFLSDLERMANGHGEYEGISQRLRLECLKNLIRLVSDPQLRIYLMVAKDEEVESVIKFFDGDSMFAIDDKFTLSRDHRGRILWSENSHYVNSQRELLLAVCDAATYRKTDTVVELLEHLCQVIAVDTNGDGE